MVDGSLDNEVNRIKGLLGGTLGLITDAYDKLSNTTFGLISGLDEQASRVVKTLGQSRDYAEGIRTSLADAVPELAQLATKGSDFATIMAMGADVQDEIAKKLQTNILLTSQQMIAIAQVQQAYSITKDELGKFMERFVTAGYSVNQFPTALEKAANNARAMGVSVDAVMDNISTGLDDVNKYGFEKGVEGLGRMAARAAAMRVEMKSVFEFAERVFAPEKAIEMVAGFQRMGVAAGDLADPFRLMYLASEDVEELQKQIGVATEKFSFFDEKSKSFKMTPNAKRDLRELTDLMGVSYDELVKYSQQSERLRIASREIKIGGIDEKSKDFIASVMQYSESQKGFVVKLLGGDEKLVSQINPEDIKSIEEANRALSPKEIAQAQLTTTQSIDNSVKSLVASRVAPLAGSRMVSSINEFLRGGFQGIANMSTENNQPRTRRENFNRETGEILGPVNDLSSALTAGSRILITTFQTVTRELGNVANDFRKIGDLPKRPELNREVMSDNQFKSLTEAITQAFQKANPVVNINSPSSQTPQFNIPTTNNFNLKEIKIVLPSGEEKTLTEDTVNKMTRAELIALIREVSRKEVTVTTEPMPAVPGALRQ